MTYTLEEIDAADTDDAKKTQQNMTESRIRYDIEKLLKYKLIYLNTNESQIFAPPMWYL